MFRRRVVQPSWFGSELGHQRATRYNGSAQCHRARGGLPATILSAKLAKGKNSRRSQPAFLANNRPGPLDAAIIVLVSRSSRFRSLRAPFCFEIPSIQDRCPHSSQGHKRISEVFQGPDVAIDSIFADHQMLAVRGWTGQQHGAPLIILQDLRVA